MVIVGNPPKKKIVLSRQMLQNTFSTLMFVVLLGGFGLHMIILSKHREKHYSKISVRHFQGEDDESIIGEDESNSLMRRYSFMEKNDVEHADEDPHLHEGKSGDMPSPRDYKLPLGFQHVLSRAKRMKRHCSSLEDGITVKKEMNDIFFDDSKNSTLADLPPFGIIETLESYQPKKILEVSEWDCVLPPPTECNETQLTAVFLGYRPDRLENFCNQVRRMLIPEFWSGMIKEILLVWNGDHSLTQSKKGMKVLNWAADPSKPFRIVYPLQEGFANDLMNRYHPRWNITTKAVLFYDDDGPFYSIPAVTSAFEYWKRNSNAQIGAMARLFDLGPRAQIEKTNLLLASATENGIIRKKDIWVSNCRQSQNDRVKYHFQHFAQTNANMALPSGSILHHNFLCFLWHPVLEPVRQFVRAHPVHPDDVTVSTIVSHVSGRPPEIYSRRVNMPDSPPNSTDFTKEGGNMDSGSFDLDNKKEKNNMGKDEGQEQHRRLLWDDGNTGIWARKREASVNSLLGYFGSLNGGSDGWCYGTPYHDKERDFCIPEQARYGMIPWMTDDMKSLPSCPQIRTIIDKQYMAPHPNTKKKLRSVTD